MASPTFDFRRDANGKPLWHNPRPNPAFDPNRPYEPDNSPFSTCALCDEPWPCAATRARMEPVPVTGIWLRNGVTDHEIEVLAEFDGEWRTVIVERHEPGAPMSHIVEPLGMRHAKPDRLTRDRADG